MSLKFKAALASSKFLIRILRLLNRGGTTLPGKVALMIYPDILEHMTQNIKIILVTGTNGKTTTSKILSTIFNRAEIRYIANRSGANLVPGVVTTFTEAFSICGKQLLETAIIEIDEAALLRITDKLSPDTLIVTNFFRDQLDRFGELYNTVSLVKNSILKIPQTTLILNGDDSLCSWLAEDVENPVLFFGIDASDDFLDQGADSDAPYCIKCRARYEYKYRIYAHLGHFKCPGCGYEKSPTHVTITEITKRDQDSSQVIIRYDGRILRSAINLPGLYNIYNALAAGACAFHHGIRDEHILSGIAEFESGFGRMETIRIEDKTIKLILIKNPTGLDQALDHLLLIRETFVAAFAINDNAADGRDVSWLWDTDAKKLKKIQDQVPAFFVSGTRAHDMSLRLKYEDIEMSRVIIEEDYSRLISRGLMLTPQGKTFYILPTYTAMLDLRRILKQKYHLKDMWE